MSRENRELIAGALLALGALLVEWGCPEQVATKGLRMAMRQTKTGASRRKRRPVMTHKAKE